MRSMCHLCVQLVFNVKLLRVGRDVRRCSGSEFQHRKMSVIRTLALNSGARASHMLAYAYIKWLYQAVTCTNLYIFI